MRKSMLAAGAALIAIGGVAVGATGAGLYGGNYGNDRAMIEDLQARYLFALDFGDPEAYANTFTEDGVLVYGSGTAVGRQEIYEVANTGMRRPQAEDGLRPAKGGHNITNIVIDVNGDRARSVAYWVSMGNNNPERSANMGAYGHYEDELVKIDGHWYFSKREVYNEQLDRRSAATQRNPVRGMWSDVSTPTWLETQGAQQSAP